MCRLSIRDPETGEWVSRTDGSGDTDVEAEKGAFSSSLKRCAVNFGIGRYLYDVASPWVELETKGRSQVIPERELARLRGMLAGKAQSNVEAPSRPAVASARPSQAEPPKTNGKHPKWDYAGARFREIERAIKGAADPKIVTEIWGVNQADLDLIEEVGLPYDKLEALRDHMLAKLSQSRVNAGSDFINEARMGSAPMLMGEP
jgi:Rad52/22 family double-strand break repair protein